MPGDPFGTATLRRRVLDAWTASTARFREDANAEDDLVRGAYRDRVVVELAQNAADAAARAGAEGRLLLRLESDRLTAANTGAPLDAAAVESLSTLRASTKRDDDTVGRFGVGFAAVLALSDEPRITSRTGSVRWDAAAARALVEAVPGLRDEMSRRTGQLPVLRLPFPAVPGAAVPGYDTVVELPLRDDTARELARELLAEVDDALLLALPALSEIAVEDTAGRRVVTDEGRWHVVRHHGLHRGSLLADRPVEERHRPAWSVTWARPLAGQRVPAVLHAPTPTDEPLDLPALLVASFPLDPSRRHIAPGAVTDALVAECAAAYVALVLDCDDPAERFALVPGPAVVGGLDGALRRSILDALAVAPWLSTVTGHPVAPRDAVTVVGAGDAVLQVCAEVLDGLVADRPGLARVGVRRLGMADLVDLLGELDRPPAWWHLLYAALATGPVDPEPLGALPVPLVDGRLVRGARGVLLPGDDLPLPAHPRPADHARAGSLGLLGLRVVHAQAAHPLLARLGAEPASARTVLERPETRAAVDSAWDSPDPDGVAEVVLGLVAASRPRPGEIPGLAALPLRDDDGDLAAADELVLPGSLVASLVAAGDLPAVHPDLVARWGPAVLAGVGVLAGLTVAEVHDVVLDPGHRGASAPDPGGGQLPDLDDWLAEVSSGLPEPAYAPSVRGVRELDVVAPEAWPALLAALAADPALRSALVDPVAVSTPGAVVPSYTSWWVRTRGLLAGRAPTEWALAGTDLDGLYDVLDVADERLAAVPAQVLAAVGVRTGLQALVDEPGGAAQLLDRLAEPSRTVPEASLRAAYVVLAQASSEDVAPPSRVRVRADLVVPAGDVVVVDHPAHLQLAWPQPPLLVPLSCAPSLAHLLDVDTSSERVRGNVAGGVERPVPAAARALVPAVPSTWCEHDDLRVDGQQVSWWVGTDGRVHAATVEGLAWGLAWVAGHWGARWSVAAVLADPGRLDEVSADAALDG